MKRLLAAALASATLLSAQAQKWSTPELGYVFDAADKSIRRVTGVPGAASMDGELPVATKISRAFIAPGRRIAVAQALESEALQLIEWTGPEVTTRELPGSRAGEFLVAFGPGGTRGAILYLGAGLVQVWSFSGETPTLEREIAAEWSSVSFSADGSKLVGLAKDGAYVTSADELSRVAEGSFAAAALRPGGDELVLAENGSDALTLVRLGSGERSQLDGELGFAEPAAIAWTEDGSKLVVANARTRNVVVLDWATRQATALSCECSPTTVAALSGGHLYRVTDPLETGLFLLHVESVSEPAVFAVPALGGAR